MRDRFNALSARQAFGRHGAIQLSLTWSGSHERAPRVYGWCPGALRPMMSGDGLVVRIRAPLGRLTSEASAEGLRICRTAIWQRSAGPVVAGQSANAGGEQRTGP